MIRTYYEILGIESDATTVEIKKAYKNSLLESHPDKRIVDSTANVRSINEIQIAYQILVDDILRKQYDEQLAESFKKQGFHNSGEGLDEFSLDCFEYTIETETFIMRCPRCMAPEGFELSEESLDVHAIDNPSGGFFVLVQCNACSLWLKIVFDVVEEV